MKMSENQLVQALNDKDVVIQVDSTVFHKKANARNIWAMMKVPTGIELLAKDLLGQI